MRKILAALSALFIANGQVFRPPPSETAAPSTVTIQQVEGLSTELGKRPEKGTTFTPQKAAVIDSSGKVGAATGNSSDCVRVDGTASPCASSGSGGAYDPSTVNSVTWGSGNQSIVTQSFNPSGPTNPTWTYSDGIVNLSVGSLQAGGVAVMVSTDAAATPGAGKVVKADVSGKIDRGWLPGMVGDSGSGGSAGAVPAPASGDAAKCLLGDGTWGECGFAPASRYQDGGEDEIATVTPAAGAIPKADSGGTLNHGWLPVVAVGQAGAVPAPSSGDAAKCLKGSGAWGSCLTGTSLTGGYMLRVDPSAPTQVEGRSAAQVLSDIGAAASGHNHSGVYEPVLGFTPENAANRNQASGYAGLDGSSKLTRSQLPVMVGDTGSGGDAGAVPAPSAGDAAAGKYLKADGTWGVPAGEGGLGTDTVGTEELNDGTDTPLAGEFVRVDSDTSRFRYDTAEQVLADIGAAPVDHNHDADYAPIVHDHDGTYEPVLGFTPEDSANKNATNGYAGLSGGKIAAGQLPVMVGDAGSGGTAGAVPAPAAGDAAKCLLGDGTWGSCGSIGYTAENVANKGAANGYAPLVSSKVPVANLPVMVGDSGAGGVAGLVPAPGPGQAGLFLKGNGTWGTPSGGGGGGAADCSYVGCQGDDNNFSGNNKFNLGTTGSLDESYQNDSTNGTVAGRLVGLTGSPSKARLLAVGATSGVIGVCYVNCGTSGFARVVALGKAYCSFENTPTAGNWVIPGTGTAGACRDAGASKPGSGVIVGRVLDATPLGGLYLIRVNVSEL